MNFKSQFELIYKTDGAVYNIPKLSKNTLEAYKINKDDRAHILALARTFGRIKNHPANKVVQNELDSIMILDFPLYPLPGFVTYNGVAALNLSVLPQKFVSDYNPVDVYTMFLYSTILKKFFYLNKFHIDNAIPISNMIFSIFMKMFGKSAGLIGSYSHLIPSLRFILTLYVYVAFFSEKNDDKLKIKIASSYYMNHEDLNLDFDFNSITEVLKCINKNNIVSISENLFSTKVINQLGISSLPMFEDISRFYATIAGATVPGNSLFSGYLSKVNTSLFNKLSYAAFTLK